MDAKAIAGLRVDYAAAALDERSVLPDPIRQFGIWLREAADSDIREPNAMSLATVDASGQPDCRIVLLKDYDERGFAFYTNYLSAKGRDLDAHPFAALTFYWGELERQVRIRGTVSRTSPEESSAYFATRPLLSRIGAAVSPQSEPIPGREWLESRFAEAEARHRGGEIARPDHWGGYRVDPSRIEFWQGRRSRLHDRVLFDRRISGEWSISRLAP